MRTKLATLSKCEFYAVHLDIITEKNPYDIYCLIEDVRGKGQIPFDKEYLQLVFKFDRVKVFTINKRMLTQQLGYSIKKFDEEQQEMATEYFMNKEGYLCLLLKKYRK